ncbi:MAG: hypothetical protein O7A04_00005, partial [Acidobacteria bacterium]|nr:hypothetical protein [Acidobacteriota bacterium]
MLGRLAGAGLALWLVASVTFFVVRLAPGDPARSLDPAVPASHAEILIALHPFYCIADSMMALTTGHLTGHLKVSGSPPRTRDFVFARVYFPFLPHGLNDPNVSRQRDR